MFSQLFLKKIKKKMANSHKLCKYCIKRGVYQHLGATPDIVKTWINLLPVFTHLQSLVWLAFYTATLESLTPELKSITKHHVQSDSIQFYFTQTKQSFAVHTTQLNQYFFSLLYHSNSLKSNSMSPKQGSEKRRYPFITT